MANDIDEVIERIKNEEDIFSKAKLIRYLLRDKDMKVYELAKGLGIQPSYVCHINRLNRIPDIIVDGYYSKLITRSHLFIISRVKDLKKMIEIYEKVLEQNLSIRGTENLIREYIYGVKEKGSYIKEKDREAMLSAISKKYPSIKVKILQTRVHGKLTFEINGSLEKSSATIKEIVSKL